MTRRSFRIAVLAALVFSVFGIGAADADDARWTIDWSSPTRAQDAERALDSLERAFGEVLNASPAASDVATSGNLLIAARTEHNKFRTNETNALMRVHEARERVDRDARLLMERRATTAWARLKGQQRQDQLKKEDDYLRTIRTVTRNREVFHQKAREKRERVTHALQAFALSWGELAVERSAGNGMSLPNDVWQEHMKLHARSFNNFVRRRYADCSFLNARTTRALRAPTRRPNPPTPRTGPQPVRDEPEGFPQPVDPGTPPAGVPGPGPVRDQPVDPWDPAPQPRQPNAPVQQPKPRPPVATTPRGKVETISGFRWYYDYASAAAAARAQGKLVLALSTRPNCAMCDKVKETMVPTDVGRVNRTAVGYIYDIMKCVGDNPTATADAIAVNRVLKANLPGATLMPLVGFMTPDKRWVAGFSGYPTQSEFRAVVDKAVRR